MHLLCRLEINLLLNRLTSTSVKSSGQTVFSKQEIEFTFQWKCGGERGFLEYLNCRNKIIYNLISNRYIRALFPITLLPCQLD